MSEPLWRQIGREVVVSKGLSGDEQLVIEVPPTLTNGSQVTLGGGAGSKGGGSKGGGKGGKGDGAGDAAKEAERGGEGKDEAKSGKAKG